MAEKRGGSRQAVVDRVFRSCMAADWRERGMIVQAIRAEIEVLKLDIDFRDETILNWSPTNYDLQVMISRIASRESPDPREGFLDRREFYPAYDEPRRFVSVARIEALVARAEKGEIEAEELESLLAMYADLQMIRDWFDEKAKTVARRQIQVTDLMVSIETTKMDLREALVLLGEVDGEEE